MPLRKKSINGKKSSNEDKFSKIASPKSKTKGVRIFSSEYKGLRNYSLILALGLTLAISGAVFGLETQMHTTDQQVENKFSTILLSIKQSFENDFNELIEEMKEDPLGGLYTDKLPIAEEIFFEEWSNDRFPKVYIPVIGGHIEEVGARIVGDVDLDGKPPEADLNISSVNNPSELSFEQCQAIWNRVDANSLVSNYPFLWFDASEGDTDAFLQLKFFFNLTDTQLNQICNWINVGKSTWISFLSQESVLAINPLPFYGLIIPGFILGTYGTFKMVPDVKKIRKSNITNLKEKKSKDPANKN